MRIACKYAREKRKRVQSESEREREIERERAGRVSFVLSLPRAEIACDYAQL